MAAMGFALILLLSLLSRIQAGLPKDCHGSTSRTVEATIVSFDGVELNADVTLPPCASSPEQRFPVVVFANSWATPKYEYIKEARGLADRGYIVLEYATRGWQGSGGMVETAGLEDQKDISAAISFVLNRSSWQPDAKNLALAGTSYGAGISLLGAARDSRVKTAVSLSGWADMRRALFGNKSPNLWAGRALTYSAEKAGNLDPKVLRMWHDVLRGNETAFRAMAEERSVVMHIQELEKRQVPLFLSQNLEDSIFRPQDTLEFFLNYTGPKKLLLNQGQHAVAELSGLVRAGHNYVWNEAVRWLDYWLMGRGGDRGGLGFMQVQLRNGQQVRENFTEWPSSRSRELHFAVGPRGAVGLNGSLLPSNGTLPAQHSPLMNESEPETISFAQQTGVFEGVPIVSDFLRGFNWQVTSNLRTASRSHAIWFYAPLQQSMRFCGTPRLSLDFSSNSGRWQVNAYLFKVNNLDEGMLLSYGSVTCWDCSPMQRLTRQLQLQTLCEDVSGGLGLALDLFSRTFEPANTSESLEVSFHYSDSFSLAVPFLQTAEPQGAVVESLFV